MDCETIQQLIDEGRRNGAIAAHLQQCPACRAEAEFAEHVASAVVALPRVSAPEGLADRVMIELRSAQRPVRSATRRPPLVLRRWEIVWLGAACLVLLVLVHAAPESWVSSTLASLTPLLPGWADVPRTASDYAAMVSGGWAEIIGRSADPGRYLTTWSAAASGWVWGALGFAAALFLLLSLRQGSAGAREWEDAHA